MAESQNLTLADNIYHYLWTQIGNLELEPGFRLSEVSLARQFNCSRIPVREAVSRLAVEGALDILPQRGSFVTQIDREQIERVRYLRDVLETRIVLDDFDKDILMPILPILKSIVARQEQLIAVNDFVQVFTLDTDFHLTFYSIDDKDFVFPHAGMTEINYYRARLLTLKSEAKENMVNQHKAIVEAIETRDRAKLEAALTKHFHNLNDVIAEHELKTRAGKPYFK